MEHYHNGKERLADQEDQRTNKIKHFNFNKT